MVGTGWVGVVVDFVIVPVEKAVAVRPRAEGVWAVESSLGRRREREEEPPIKAVPNFPCREAGLLAKTERASAVS